ncbi:ABC transporter substrate-binding protein [Uniformispora flossi]|uniref:ABC transporter substrate-binding protein n=1 Tax=Uniformispora flossi TaxID=3390723 RepID=UPI003C2CFD53
MRARAQGRPNTRPARARALRRAAAVAAVLLAATACGGGKSAKHPPADGASGTPARGGSLTFLLPVDSRALDPFSAAPVNVADASRLAAIYDPLLLTDAATGAVRPHLAESLTSADNGATWILKLRPNVAFSDGTPFDAEAVKYTWERHADPAVRSLQAAAATGLALTVADPLTLKIVPPTPNATFDHVVASALTYIASPTALRADPAGFASKPVGAGPFMLTEWVRGDHQTLKRNPKYWQGPDKPYLDQVVFKTTPDLLQGMNAVAGGQADLTVSVDPGIIAQAKDHGLAATSLDLHGGQMLAFNNAKPPFDDPRARRAVSLAIDPAELNKLIYDGKATVAHGVLSSARLGGAQLAPQPGTDKAEAQRLFDELAAAGKPLDFGLLVTQNPTTAKVAEYLQSRLGAFRNVHMRVDAVAAAQFVPRQQIQRDYQATLTQQWIDDPEPALAQLLTSASKQNWLGYANPAVDQAFAAARATTDPAARTAAFASVQQALDTDLPFFVTLTPSTAVLAGGGITGVAVYNDGAVLMDRIGRR